MARMYNRKKNNTSTTIYPKCHNTDSKECLVPILFLLFFYSPPPTCSSSLPFQAVTHSHAHELATRKLSTAEGHLYADYGEKRQLCSLSCAKKRERKWEKNEQHFPFLERSPPFTRSLARFLSRLPAPDYSDVMYKE